LNPAPKAGADVTDGWVQVHARTAAPNVGSDLLLAAHALQVAPFPTPLAAQPVIDWNADARKADSSALRISSKEPQRKWSVDFVDSLGKSAEELNPNQRLKVKLPTVVPAAKPVSSLKR